MSAREPRNQLQHHESRQHGFRPRPAKSVPASKPEPEQVIIARIHILSAHVRALCCDRPRHLRRATGGPRDRCPAENFQGRRPRNARFQVECHHCNRQQQREPALARVEREGDLLRERLGRVREKPALVCWRLLAIRVLREGVRSSSRSLAGRARASGGHGTHGSIWEQGRQLGGHFGDIRSSGVPSPFDCARFMAHDVVMWMCRGVRVWGWVFAAPAAHRRWPSTPPPRQQQSGRSPATSVHSIAAVHAIAAIPPADAS